MLGALAEVPVTSSSSRVAGPVSSAGGATLALGLPKEGVAIAYSDGSIEVGPKEVMVFCSVRSCMKPSECYSLGLENDLALAPGSRQSLSFDGESGMLVLSKLEPLAAGAQKAAAAAAGTSTEGWRLLGRSVVKPLRHPEVERPRLKVRPDGVVRLVCISDTHMMHEELVLPKGDILIHTGDFCHEGTVSELRKFIEWLKRQPFEHKLVVAGNHDFCLDEVKADEMHFSARTNRSSAPAKDWMRSGRETAADSANCIAKHAHYLFDSGVKIHGIRFWGSPYQPKFEGAFGLDRESSRLRSTWERVPQETDILLSHTPPHERRDKTPRSGNVGCKELLACCQRVRPMLNIFGHIHEGHGLECEEYGDARGGSTVYVNAASVDLGYNLCNEPVVIDVRMPEGAVRTPPIHGDIVAAAAHAKATQEGAPVLETNALVIDGFVPATRFQGGRQGFVFKMGPAGLGYYPDGPRGIHGGIG
jgi:predicted phosphohydrolase